MRAAMLRERRVEGADGLRIHLVEWSEEGVPMLLLHGYGNDARVWDDFAPVVAPAYRTVAMDLRGHGDSDWDPEHRYGYDAHVRDVEAVAAALGAERLVLVGHSFGGRVAALFAGAHPERTAGLVLVDSGPEVDPRGATRIRQDAAQKLHVSWASAADYEAALRRAYPAARPEAIARLARTGLRRREGGRLERKTDPDFRAGRIALSEEERAESERETTRALWQALRAVPCPALVVRGAASDILSPDCAERMVEDALPDGRLAVVPRAGHSVMLDNPEGFAEAVADFALA